MADAHVASADSLSDRLNAANKREAITVEVACGKLDKANCAQVLPHIAQRTADAGITLMPLESEGSVESTDGVCQGLVPLAIGQRDAIDLRYRKPDCVGKLSVVGKPLYPYWGFLVVRADNPKNGLTGMIDGVN